VNTTGGGDAIVLKPRERLEPNTQYTFEVNGGCRDTAGAAFKYFASTFTTAASGATTPLPVAFEQVALPAAQGEMFTSLAFGPDHRLYASTMDGRVVRFAVAPDGSLTDAQTFPTVAAHNHGPRLVTGICFDPAATAQNPVLWVSHGQLVLKEATDWSGRISRLSGPNLSDYQDVVVGLPRAVRDHLNNQPVFGPDGALYFCQASCTAMGAPDGRWGMRPEHLLSAAILRLDVSKLSKLPLDVKTEEGGTYDPRVGDPPLTIYATGVRNAYDLLWHSNDRLYAPVNASAAGGNTPGGPTKKGHGFEQDVPALVNVRQTLDDGLYHIERGMYYGHPNPLRDQFVLNGGNPTAGPDPMEISDYPVGIKPYVEWRPPVYVFGKNLAPTGIIEYRGDAFGGLLRGKVLVCRYSGGDDILVLSLDERGEVTEAVSGVEGFTRLMDPLDLVEDPATGNLYVAEFQPKRLTLLRPKSGGVSQYAYRQPWATTQAAPPQASGR
jgi:glucose/arabinose dehydrogenase